MEGDLATLFKLFDSLNVHLIKGCPAVLFLFVYSVIKYVTADRGVECRITGLLRRYLATLFIGVPCKLPNYLFLVPGKPDLHAIFDFTFDKDKF